MIVTVFVFRTQSAVNVSEEFDGVAQATFALVRPVVSIVILPTVMLATVPTPYIDWLVQIIPPPAPVTVKFASGLMVVVFDPAPSKSMLFGRSIELAMSYSPAPS